MLDQRGPHHGVEAFADRRPRRHVDQNGAEQRQRDADAAEDEIFPRRFERFVGAVDADHHHRGQRRQLDGDPHHADIVGDQREIHREHQHLVHGMIEAHEARRELAVLELVTDVACAEYAGGKSDERREHDKGAVEVVDKEIGSGLRPRDEQRYRRREGGECRQNVEARRDPVSRQQRQQRCREHRGQQYGGKRIEHHRRSPRKRSSACKSTVSKRSRIRNRKMPMTMKAIRIEKATLISTTSGMPLAPVAARTRPFSSDMKPTTWLTALRRVTIIRRPSSTTDSAKARSSRASGSASLVTRSMTTIDSATSAMPASMVKPIPTTVSISRWMPR